jgi:phosphatidylglycerophosphate synthase
MITIVNWYDFALLIAPFFLCIIAAFCMENHKVVAIMLFIISGLSFLGSLVWSVIANKGNVFNMITSVFAKLFICYIAFIAVLLIVLGFFTKNNNEISGQEYQNRKDTARTIGIAGFLIFSLISTVNHKELTAKLKDEIWK